MLPNLPGSRRRWLRMTASATQAVVKTAHFEKHWESEGERIERRPAILRFKCRPFAGSRQHLSTLSPNAGAPRPQEFGRPAFDPHGKCLNQRFRRLNRSAGRSRSKRLSCNGSGGAVIPGGCGYRARATASALAKSSPLSHAPAFRLSERPSSHSLSGLDVELPLQLWIDRLHPVTGDGPLPADPVDVAMQRHGRSSLPSGARRPLAKIPGAAAQATPARADFLRDIRGEAYCSRATTFTPPI